MKTNPASRLLAGVLFAVSAISALTACGFTPLHAPSAYNNSNRLGSPLPAMLLSFEKTNAQGISGDKLEYLLRQAISDRMASSTAQYELKLNSSIVRNALGYTEDDIASRYDLKLTVTYSLIDLKSGNAVSDDRLLAVSTFSAPTDPYARISAQNNARERLASEISDRLVLKLGTYFSAQRSKSDET